MRTNERTQRTIGKRTNKQTCPFDL